MNNNLINREKCPFCGESNNIHWVLYPSQDIKTFKCGACRRFGSMNMTFST
jgi:transcription elongation factor Elf1